MKTQKNIFLKRDTILNFIIKDNAFDYVERMMMRGRCLLLLKLFAGLTTSLADFGDFVDPTFNCPATTTCPVVCMAEDQQCPDALTCDEKSGLNSTLCMDGSCSTDCTSANLEFDPDESPCPSCRPVIW